MVRVIFSLASVALFCLLWRYIKTKTNYNRLKEFSLTKITHINILIFILIIAISTIGKSIMNDVLGGLVFGFGASFFYLMIPSK